MLHEKLAADGVDVVGAATAGNRDGERIICAGGIVSRQSMVESCFTDGGVANVFHQADADRE